MSAAARLLARGRTDALAQADHWADEDAWSTGCRAYAFSKHQLARAAESGRYSWLKILGHTHHFVFLIDGTPVRFFRGDARDPSERTLRQQEIEAQQLALALGGDQAEGLMFRLAVETRLTGGSGGSCSSPCVVRKAKSSASGRCRSGRVRVVPAATALLPCSCPYQPPDSSHHVLGAGALRAAAGNLTARHATPSFPCTGFLYDDFIVPKNRDFQEPRVFGIAVLSNGNTTVWPGKPRRTP